MSSRTSILIFVATLSSLTSALPFAESEDNGEKVAVVSEDVNQLNKILDDKLQLLAEAFRNNAMDPLNVKIAYMPVKGPVRRWALNNARHKDEAFQFINDQQNTKPILGAETDDEFILVPLDGESTNDFVEYNIRPGNVPEVSTQEPAKTGKGSNETDESLQYPDQPNAQLFGLSDMTRNGSVLLVQKEKRQQIICPVSIGPFRLIMTSPNLDDPLHATHAIARSIPVELTFKREKGSLQLTKLRIPRIAAKETIVFLSKTEKFASRKDELNAARLATHISLELGKLWAKDTPLLRQIDDAYRNFFNV